MTQNLLLMGTTTGLATSEKLEQEKALYIAWQLLTKRGYRVIFYTENREAFVNLRIDPQLLVVAEINLHNLKKVIQKFAIELILPTFSSFNTLLTIKSFMKTDFYQRHPVKLINLNMQTLKLTISHHALNTFLQNQGFRLIEHQLVPDFSAAQKFVIKQGFPVIIRSSNKEIKTYWNTISTIQQLQDFFEANPSNDGYEVERSINNFKEITMVIIGDKFANQAVVYSSEDVDPIGIHSTDSISVTPIFSISNTMYQRLRDAVLRLCHLLKIVGMCTFHLAVDEATNSFYILEISPLFQSKILPMIESLGYPLFEVVCEVGLGQRLQKVETLSGTTINAAVELTPNHITARFPIWQTTTQKDLVNNLGPRKTSTGAIIVNGNNLETVVMKGLKACNLQEAIFLKHLAASLSDEEIEVRLFTKNVQRIIAVCEALDRGFEIAEVQSFTKYNLTFLQTLQYLLQLSNQLQGKKGDLTLLIQAQEAGFDDQLLAQLWQITPQQIKQIRQQLRLNQIQQATPASFDIDQGAVLNYYSSYLQDPDKRLPNYQITLANEQNADVLSNYEMVMLTHRLIHHFQADGFSVAVRGNLLNNLDSLNQTDFYTDSLEVSNGLYNSKNILRLHFNTQEKHNQNYQLAIYNLWSYLHLWDAEPLQEVVFIQDQNQQLWLASPISSQLTQITPQRWEFVALSGKHQSQIVQQATAYIHQILPTVKYGTLFLKNDRVIQFLPGFTTNIGLTQEVNTNFINVLIHVLMGIDSSFANNKVAYFGRKVTLYRQKNGLYTSRIKYLTTQLSNASL